MSLLKQGEDFKQRYSKICKEMGVEPILPLQSLDESCNGRLVLSHTAIGEKAACAIAEALSGDKFFVELHFIDTYIGDPGCKSLSTALHYNSSLTTVVLRGNNIRGIGAAAIADLLQVNKTITSVSLEWNNLGTNEGGIASLAAALQSNRTLTLLDIRNNKILPDGARSIADMLTVNSTLESLDMRWNKIGGPGGRALAEALTTNTSLTCLSLGGNEVEDSVLRTINQKLAVNAKQKAARTIAGTDKRKVDELLKAKEKDLQELDRSRNDILELRRQLDEVTTTFQQRVFCLTKENEECQHLIADLRGRLETSEVEASSRATRDALIEQEHLRLQFEAREQQLRSHVDHLEAELKQHAALSAHEKAQLSNLEDSVLQLQEKLREKTDELETLQRRERDAVSRTEQLDLEVAALRQQIQAEAIETTKLVQLHASDLHAAEIRAHTDLEKAAERERELQSQLLDLQRRMVQEDLHVKRREDDARVQYATLEGRLQAAMATSEAAHVQLNELHAKLTAASAKTEEQAKAIRTLEEIKIEKHRQNLDLAERVKEVESDLSLRRAELDLKNRQVSALEDQLDAEKRAVAGLVERTQKFQAEQALAATVLQEAVAREKREMQRLCDSAVAEYEGQLRSRDAQIAELRAEKDALLERHHKLFQDKDERTRQLAETKTQLEIEAAKLTSALTEQKADFTRVLFEKAEMERARAAALEQLNQSNAAHQAKLEDMCNRFSSEQREKDAKLQQKTEQIISLENQLRGLQERHHSMRDEVQRRHESLEKRLVAAVRTVMEDRSYAEL